MLACLAALAGGTDATDARQEGTRSSLREQALARMTPADAVERSIEVDGRERDYWLVAPALASPRPRPVLFVLHGGGTADARVTFRYRFQDIALREGFITVHPNGLGAGWNDGRDTGFLLDRGGAPDDVAFFRAMIARLVADGMADPQRIFVMGGSNGALMTLRLACELADVIAGAAAVSGSMPAKLVERCKPSRPVPLLMIAGTADDLMPFDGGPVASASGQDRGTVTGARPTFDLWRQINRCDARRVTREAWPDKVPDDGTTISVESGERCVAPTRLMIVQGGGHAMPGTAETKDMRRPPGMERSNLSPSRELDGAAYIWEFLKAAKPTTDSSPRAVSQITLPARDGRSLKAVLSMPEGSGPFPVLMAVHGGQGDRDYDVLRNVADPRSDSPTVQLFNQRPWIILAPGYRNDWFGREETDIVDAIRYAATLPKADPSRIGVFGGSNGGRLTLRAAVLDPQAVKCVGAGSPFLAHPPAFFGDKSQPPWSLTSEAAQNWMSRARQLLQGAVERSAARAGQTPEQLLLAHSSQLDAGKIRARVLLLTSRADEQVPAVMLDGLIDAFARSGNPAEVVALEKSLHGFYWGREGEFGARAGRGPKTDAQLDEEKRAHAATLRFFDDCFAGG